MKTLLDYKKEFDELTVELDAAKAMPEADVCKMYNVDSKQEAVTILEEEIVIIRAEMEMIADAEPEPEGFNPFMIFAYPFVGEGGRSVNDLKL
ncbi:MAG: hypothetical protein LBQ73_06745 [Tannerellaceae bacterium]|jgi:hypothetical protein|nr:hypothetical protein [Tannerellaceae bacterium]